jgi:hypothetical protein
MLHCTRHIQESFEIMRVSIIAEVSDMSEMSAEAVYHGGTYLNIIHIRNRYCMTILRVFGYKISLPMYIMSTAARYGNGSQSVSVPADAECQRLVDVTRRIFTPGSRELCFPSRTENPRFRLVLKSVQHYGKPPAFSQSLQKRTCPSPL